ncbi:MAG TPA: hypothetical protein PLX62_12640 [Bacteroidales bacterium]|jgi:hypothetical protein|nr:hypothetical protein [Bacteroidales bacterium]
MNLLVFSEKFLVVLHRSFDFLRKLCQWRQRWNDKVPVVGVLLFEIVFWFHVWIPVMKDIDKTTHDLLDFTLRELGADPDDEPGYFGHMGLPPLWSRNYTNPTLVGGGKSF